MFWNIDHSLVTQYMKTYSNYAWVLYLNLLLTVIQINLDTTQIAYMFANIFAYLFQSLW